MATLAGKQVMSTEAGGKKSSDDRAGFQVYKPGEGYATRLGMMLVGGAFTIFAGYHWYYGWRALKAFLKNRMGMAFIADWTNTDLATSIVRWGGVGTIVLILGGLVYYYVYIKPRTSEFLIKTDLELAKVTWPKTVPWFKADTKVWGSTYVVLITVVFLTLFIFIVDYALQFLAKVAFLSG